MDVPLRADEGEVRPMTGPSESGRGLSPDETLIERADRENPDEMRKAREAVAASADGSPRRVRAGRTPSPDEQKFMHDPVNMLLAEVYAKRHGFDDFMDVRPLELMVIIVDDVKAVRAAFDEAGYVIAPARGASDG
jgi:hypothetical protein